MFAETQRLLEFIDAMKDQGASDEFVVALLRQNGWSEKRVYQAFSSWYEPRVGKAVPNGGGRIEAAKDSFLYLLAFITLGIWAIQLGALFFATIDRTFPDPASDYTNATWVARSLANELASIIVAFPLFLLVTREIVRGVQRQPERLESSVRKRLTYIALVITAITMIGDVAATARWSSSIFSGKSMRRFLPISRFIWCWTTTGLTKQRAFVSGCRRGHGTICISYPLLPRG